MLRYMTAGESHGKGFMVILDSVPAGLKIDEGFINNELARRMLGYGRGGRMKIESDKADVISGVRKGVTIGSPVGIFVKNKDFKIDELPEIKCPRPGHADLAGMQKYDLEGARGVLERASARETVARVSAGAVAKLLLKEFGIDILSHVTAIGRVEAKSLGLSFDELRKISEASDVRCADSEAAKHMREAIDAAGKAGDTLGGTIEVIARGVIAGLGSYTQWDRRLDARLSYAVMSIPAVKALSIGNGIACAGLMGSESHDPIEYDASQKKFRRRSNNAGGLEGGVSNGSDITVKVFMKPIATLMTPLGSVDVDTKKRSSAAVERADVCAVPACGVVAESVTTIEIAGAFLEKFGGDSIKEIKRNYEGYARQLRDM